jgi:hypothetical protein
MASPTEEITGHAQPPRPAGPVIPLILNRRTGRATPQAGEDDARYPVLIAGTPARDFALAGRSRMSVPAWTLRTMAVSGALLALAGAGWLLSWLLLRVPLMTVAVAMALLLASLTASPAGRLRRVGLPPRRQAE